MINTELYQLDMIKTTKVKLIWWRQLQGGELAVDPPAGTSGRERRKKPGWKTTNWQDSAGCRVWSFTVRRISCFNIFWEKNSFILNIVRLVQFWKLIILPGTLQSVKRDTIVHSALQKLSLSISIDEGNKTISSGDNMKVGGSVWLLLLSKSDN